MIQLVAVALNELLIKLLQHQLIKSCSPNYGKNAIINDKIQLQIQLSFLRRSRALFALQGLQSFCNVSGRQSACSLLVDCTDPVQQTVSGSLYACLHGLITADSRSSGFQECLALFSVHSELFESVHYAPCIMLCTLCSLALCPCIILDALCSSFHTCDLPEQQIATGDSLAASLRLSSGYLKLAEIMCTSSMPGNRSSRFFNDRIQSSGESTSTVLLGVVTIVMSTRRL